MSEENLEQPNTTQDADTYEKAKEEYNAILQNMDLMKADIEKLLRQARSNNLK